MNLYELPLIPVQTEAPEFPLHPYLQVTLQGGDELTLIARTCYSFVFKPSDDQPQAAAVDSPAGLQKDATGALLTVLTPLHPRMQSDREHTEQHVISSAGSAGKEAGDLLKDLLLGPSEADLAAQPNQAGAVGTSAEPADQPSMPAQQAASHPEQEPAQQDPSVHASDSGGERQGQDADATGMQLDAPASDAAEPDASHMQQQATGVADTGPEADTAGQSAAEAAANSTVAHSQLPEPAVLSKGQQADSAAPAPAQPAGKLRALVMSNEEAAHCTFESF